QQDTFAISTFKLALTAYGADGSALPDAVSATCTLDPTTQDPTVAKASGGHGDYFATVTAPGSPTFSDIRATQATLSWGASSTSPSPGNNGPIGVLGYRVTDDDGRLVASTNGSTTQVTISGLSPSTITGYTVSAYTNASGSNTSPPANSVSVTTLRTDQLAPAPADTAAPTAPGTPSVKPRVGSDVVDVTWPAATDATGVTSYRVTAAPTGYPLTVATVTTTSTSPSAALTLPKNGVYDVTVTALDAAGNVSAASAATSFSTIPVDITRPGAPGKPAVSITTGADDFPSTIASVSWTPSTDDVGVVGYTLTVGKVDDSGLPAATAPIVIDTIDTSVVVPATQLTAGSTYDFTVTARDAAGNVSPASATTRATAPRQTSPPLPDHVAPTAPGQPSASFLSDSPTALLTWAPSTDNVGVTGYAVEAVPVDPSASIVTTTSTTASAPLNGLVIGAPYDVTVTALDAAGNTSAKSPVARITVPNSTGPVPTGYTGSGAATLKNLAKGSLPFAANLNGVAVSGNRFTGQLGTLSTLANLKALGFLTVTAGIDFVPTEALTGTLTGSSLSATLKARIKVPSMKILGVQIAGGANCQATQIATIPLTSSSFSWSKGGTLAGTFAISNLSGCGALNGLVSPLTAGSGNTMALTLVAS
ncbi:MAG: fibronectin type III domain-containing protein, partial [Solirubrobacteraceae bacterium]